MFLAKTSAFSLYQARYRYQIKLWPKKDLYISLENLFNINLLYYCETFKNFKNANKNILKIIEI